MFFLNHTALLCEKIRSNGAVPILYATWAYQRGEKLQQTEDRCILLVLKILKDFP